MSYTNVIDLSCTNLHVYNLENADFVDMSQNITDISSIVTDISQSITNNKLSLLREKLLNTEGDNVVITFEDGTTMSTLDDAMGLTGPTGFQGFTGQQGTQGAGYQGATGPTGVQGFQGDTLAWWNAFEYQYDSTYGGIPTTGTFRRKLNYGNNTYTITSATISDLNLEILVQNNVIRKRVNTPSAGYTTYTLLQNLIINTGSDETDYSDTYNFFLDEGYIFDGDGYNIDISNNNNTTPIGGLFKLKEYTESESAYLKKGNTIKNIYLSGTAPVHGATTSTSLLKQRVGFDGGDYRAACVNVSIQNILCTRMRCLSNAEHNSVCGIVPTFFPGKDGYLLCENCIVRRTSYSSPLTSHRPSRGVCGD